ncbi:hypothetical protein [Ensifer adhaerens]|uniref:hypothetical protein n=1 Tax=Ensifer adhaerens TaxID=106592 RepID=UPI001C4E1A6C|nr:hypothetical protein [Ensifer adhaerens]MBW0366646.1 hypothetical protein [Ensifer adhaerens]UCM18409.1 hypothetical protein LDL63_11115 [Ensifer adhaerens]
MVNAAIDNYSLLEETEASLWLALSRSQNALRPPYPPTMQVTPLSIFGEDRWLLPTAWFPAGSHTKADLNFLANGHLSNGHIRRLDPGSLLMQQLKETTYSLLHIIHIFSDARKPATVANSFAILRKLVIAAAEAGCRSLSEITPANAISIIELASSGRIRIEFVTWLENLAELTRRGYITAGVQNYDFEIEIVLPNRDSSIPKGKQPLDDNERALLLAKLLLVMENQDEFICWTEDCLATPSSHRPAQEWLSTIFPQVAERRYRFPDLLIHLYQGTTGLLIGEALGPRPSELLSTEKGFIHRHGPDAFVSLDHFTLDSVTTKSIRKIGGVRRRLRIPELVYKAAVGLEEMHSLLGQRTPRLFSGVSEELEYSTNRWNWVLQRFCEVTELPFSVTQYTARKTLISNVARTITNGLSAAQVLMDHEDRGTTAGYGLSNPFVREEIYAECLNAFRDGTRTLVEMTAAAGGPGLGGKGGARLEARVASLAGKDGVVVPEAIKIFVEELLQEDVVPIPVARGVLCMKQATAKGECGSVVPDVGGCKPSCTAQVQQQNRRDLMLWELEMARSGGLEEVSLLQKAYWVNEIEAQLAAWPDLRPDFEGILTTVPALRGIR